MNLTEPCAALSMDTIFSNAHRDYQKGLSAHAFFKVQNYEASQDLVQDTYLKTWNFAQRGGKIIVMKAFLYHVLNNLIIDQYRKRSATSLDAMMENGYDAGTDDHESIVSSLDGQRAATHIGSLSKIYRDAIKLRFMEGLTLGEMEERTGVEKGILGVHIHRGLQKLRKLHESSLTCAA